MKKTFLELLFVLICITFIVSACKPVEVVQNPTNGATALMTAANNTNQVVATVNGEEILKTEWDPIYNAYSQYYTNETQLAQLKTDILDMLINQKLWEQKAKAAGYFNYTQEQRAAAKVEVEKLIQKDIAAKAEELKISMGDTPGPEGKDYLAMAKEQYERDMKDNDDTIEKRTENKLKADAMKKFKAGQTAEFTPSDSDIIAKYNSLKQEQNETINDNSPSEYITLYNKMLSDMVNTDADQGTILVKNLYGYIRVQHIFIKYDEKNSKTILQKATETLNSVKGKNEAEFIKVMLEKTEDTGMNTEAAAKQGYLVGKEDNMDLLFHDAALQLKNPGDISGLVAGVTGYHIIRKIDNVTAGIVPFDKVRDRIVNILTDELHKKKWDEIMVEWTKESTIIKYTEKLS